LFNVAHVHETCSHVEPEMGEHCRLGFEPRS
jgi:hypothetical protein